MFSVKRFISEHIALSVCTLGFAVVGYLGYRAVKWIIDKCSKTEKIDNAFRSIVKREEFKEFKNNWKTFVVGSTLTKTVKEYQAKYEKMNPVDLKLDLGNQTDYLAFLGHVNWVPGEFNMWMPGVALVASYLTGKKEKEIKGLFVCESLEAFSSSLKEIALNPKDQRCAFIIGIFPPGYSPFKPNYPQHKVPIFVDKQDGELTIAVIDSEPINVSINPSHLAEELWKGYNILEQFQPNELVFNSILKALIPTKTKARLLQSQVIREKSYGCAIFALQDAVAYLKDPQFFKKITLSKEVIELKSGYNVEMIELLPPEFMIGTQSNTLLEIYKRQTSQKAFDQQLVGKKKSLQGYLSKNCITIKGNVQNHYITKKMLWSLMLVFLSLKYLKPEEIKKTLKGTFITKIDPSLFQNKSHF